MDDLDSFQGAFYSSRKEGELERVLDADIQRTSVLILKRGMNGKRDEIFMLYIVRQKRKRG